MASNLELTLLPHPKQDGGYKRKLNSGIPNHALLFYRYGGDLLQMVMNVWEDVNLFHKAEKKK